MGVMVDKMKSVQVACIGADHLGDVIALAS